MSPPDIRLSKSDRTAARTDSKACGRTQRTKARYRAQVLPRLRAGQDGVHRRRPTTSSEEILVLLQEGIMKIRWALFSAAILYRVPEIVTRGRFPDGGESDSTWRTQEARHVGSDTIAPGSSCATASRFCHEDP